MKDGRTMNLADTRAVDFARLLIAQSQPAKRSKHGRNGEVAHYCPVARARKKAQREARKRNR